MKIKLLLPIITALTLSCQSSGVKENNTYTIKGKLNGAKDSTVLILSNYSINKALDTTYVINGKFEFSGKLEGSEPHEAIIRSYDALRKGSFPRHYNDFLLENTNYNIDCSYADFTTAKFSGSRNNDILYGLEESVSVLRKESNDINNLLRKDATKEDIKRRNNSLSQIGNKITAKQVEYLMQYPNSYAVAVFLTKASNSLSQQKDRLLNKVITKGDSTEALAEIEKQLAPLKKLYESLSDKIKSSYTGMVAQEMLYGKRPQVGEKFIPIEGAIYLDGKPFNLSDIKTKYIVIDFTGVACHWCKVFNHTMMPDYDSIKDNVTIVSYYNESNRDYLTKHIKEEGIPWVVISDFKGDASINHARYRTFGIPDFYLINQDYAILSRDMGFSEEHIAKLKKYATEAN